MTVLNANARLLAGSTAAALVAIAGLAFYGRHHWRAVRVGWAECVMRVGLGI